MLECGSDPTVRDEHERLPYPLCVSKEARQAYRDYRGAHPDQYDWVKSAVPEPLTEEQKQKQKEKKSKARARAKERAKEKAKEKAKVGEEGEGED